MVVTKINVKAHLSEYVRAKYFDAENSCVNFPDKLDIYHTLYDLLEKRPKDCPVDEGNLPLGIPHRKTGKDPLYYNYLGQRSQKIIEKRINIMFFSELHAWLDYNKKKQYLNYIDAAHKFLCKYRIDSISVDALIKDFYRWRENVRRIKKRKEYSR